MYALYYPEEGRYSTFMTLRLARMLKKHFPTAQIIDAQTAEAIA